MTGNESIEAQQWERAEHTILQWTSVQHQLHNQNKAKQQSCSKTTAAKKKTNSQKLEVGEQ